MSGKIRLRNTFWVIVTLVPVVGLIFSLTDPQSFIEAQNLWRQRISSWGVLGPVVFVLFQVLQVVITPISHYTVGVIGGFLYGPYWGGLLNWIGRMIGHMMAFYLSRCYGRKLVEKFVDEDTVIRFDRYVSGGEGMTLQSLILFLIYFLPFFPDDEISYIVGLSKMPTKNFFLANLFGHVGGSLSLAYLGSGLNTDDPVFWVLFISTLAGFPLIWGLQRWHRKTIK